MKSRLILAGIAAALLTAPAARAADIVHPSYKAPAYVAPAAANWTGFYLGINGGYGFGSSDWDDPAISLDPSGGLAGATLGYNWQTGSWVWGLEGDIDWADIKGDTACGIGTCETKAEWLGTARLRVGYAGWNNWLPYFTGGAAFAGLKADNSLSGTTASKTQLGWTAGVGVEYAFRSNWSAKIEYLYADLGSFDCSTACSLVTPDNVSFKVNLIRAGINYRF
jgi:outer membrane immunogenic protein